MTDFKKSGLAPNLPSSTEHALPTNRIVAADLAAVEDSLDWSSVIKGDQSIGAADDAGGGDPQVNLHPPAMPIMSGLAVKMAQATHPATEGHAGTAQPGFDSLDPYPAIVRSQARHAEEELSLDRIMRSAMFAQPANTRQPSSVPRQAKRTSLIAVLAMLTGAFAAGGLTSSLMQTEPDKTQAPAKIQAPLAAAPAKTDELIWLDLLQPGAVSPRGQSAKDIAADEAFRIANAKIHGLDGKPDIEEARYWLRVGVADTLAGGRLPWALTQLGTLYARPQASPSDFAAARGVWEVAAAARDPVALCFLAMLEEGGFGTAPNRQIALALYRQAQEAGTCERADSAIARLSC